MCQACAERTGWLKLLKCFGGPSALVRARQYDSERFGLESRLMRGTESLLSKLLTSLAERVTVHWLCARTLTNASIAGVSGRCVGASNWSLQQHQELRVLFLGRAKRDRPYQNISVSGSMGTRGYESRRSADSPDSTVRS